MKNDLYQCSDFDRATVLKYFDCELVKMFRDQGKRVWCFQRNKNMDEVLASYWRGELVVNAVTFLATQRFMKSSLYNHGNNE